MSLDKLISKCLDLDRAAQKQLYLDHHSYIMSIANRYADHVDDAKDIVQNTFIRIFTHLASYDVKSGSFNAWIRKICIREGIALWRKKPNHERYFLNTEVLEVPITEDILATLTLTEVDQVINSLPEQHRLIMMMYYYDELSHKEISDLLGINESSSRSKLSRARGHFELKWKLINE